MKTKTWGYLTLSLLLLISSCKDPCKDYDCGNGTCTEVDGEATCVCDANYEGERCDTEVNEKFIGNYSVADTCQGGGATDSYSLIISAGTEPNVFIFDNLSGSNEPFSAEINSDGISFTIPSQTLFNGTFSGSGQIDPSSGVITVSHVQSYPGYADYICEGTLTKN